MSDWTDERIARLKELHAERWSASEIAGAMHITRNAVIGKLHRLGIVGPLRVRKLKPSIRRRGPRTTGRADLIVHRAAARKQYKAPPPVAPTPTMIGVLGLTECTCRFPLNDPKGPLFGFCGSEEGTSYPGAPYCLFHAKLAYRPPERRDWRQEFRARVL